jgi:hypothetical protein
VRAEGRIDAVLEEFGYEAVVWLDESDMLAEVARLKAELREATARIAVLEARTATPTPA